MNCGFCNLPVPGSDKPRRGRPVSHHEHCREVAHALGVLQPYLPGGQADELHVQLVIGARQRWRAGRGAASDMQLPLPGVVLTPDVDDNVPCWCGHTKAEHAGGFGVCNATLAVVGFGEQACSCDEFTGMHNKEV